MYSDEAISARRGPNPRTVTLSACARAVSIIGKRPVCTRELPLYRDVCGCLEREHFPPGEVSPLTNSHGMLQFAAENLNPCQVLVRNLARHATIKHTKERVSHSMEASLANL